MDLEWSLSKGPSKTVSLGKLGLEPAQLVHPEETVGQGPYSSCPFPTPTHVPGQPRSHLTPPSQKLLMKCALLNAVTITGAKNKALTSALSVSE